jgi:hypothetical protein
MGFRNTFQNTYTISWSINWRNYCGNANATLRGGKLWQEDVSLSFHYKPDSQRVAQVRQIGAIEGNKPATDNDWETVTSGGDAAIKKYQRMRRREPRNFN